MNAANARELVVEADLAGQRLDNFLLRELKGVPRQLLYRLVRTGKVRLNGARAKPSAKLKGADRIHVPAIRTGAGAALGREPAAALPPVVFEDEGLLVIDKPAGLPVHGGSGLSHGLIEQARAAAGNPRLELAHRLDKDTSGLLILAKRRSYLRTVHALLRTGGVTKTYVALVFGSWAGGRRVIDAPLRKVEAARGGRRSVVDAREGRRARTRCWKIAAFASGAEVGIDLVTGKTHQARVHLAGVGHPIVGDGRYGSRELNALARKAGCRGLMLHASELQLQLPQTGRLRLASAVPERFAAARRMLESG